jgi:hypothetical protein
MTVLDIEHSLLWHDPGRFSGYVLSQHFAGTPVDPSNLRDALQAVKERAASRQSGEGSAWARMRSAVTLGSAALRREWQRRHRQGWFANQSENLPEMLSTQLSGRASRIP